MIHNVLMRDLMMTHNSYEVHMSGLKASMGASTFCIAFHQAINAVAWCSSAQRALIVADWPAGLLRINSAHAEYGNSSNEHFVYCGLCVRMGVHVGPVHRIMDPKTHRVEYVGLAVKGAMAIAHVSSGGQVLVSPDVKAELADLPDEIGWMCPLWIQHMGRYAHLHGPSASVHAAQHRRGHLHGQVEWWQQHHLCNGHWRPMRVHWRQVPQRPHSLPAGQSFQHQVHAHREPLPG
jgi:hypothetical protein